MGRGSAGPPDWARNRNVPDEPDESQRKDVGRREARVRAEKAAREKRERIEDGSPRGVIRKAPVRARRHRGPAEYDEDFEEEDELEEQEETEDEDEDV